jgi:hypothetical protein
MLIIIIEFMPVSESNLEILDVDVLNYTVAFNRSYSTIDAAGALGVIIAHCIRLTSSGTSLLWP